MDVLNRLFTFKGHTFVKYQKQASGSDGMCSFVYSKSQSKWILQPVNFHFNIKITIISTMIIIELLQT